MPKVTIRAVRLDKPGNSLATWLAAHHPDLFLTMFKAAKQAQLTQKAKLHGLRGLGQDDGSSSDFSIAEPQLETINVDTESLVPPNLLSDSTDSGASFLSTVSESPTSSGSTLGNTLSSVGSGVLGAIGSVGNYLTSATGINTLAGVAKGFFTSQAAQSTAQTQQSVLQAQLARASAGRTAAPITYSRDANGNLVPVYATQTASGPVYQALTSQGIANLTPSGLTVFLSKYGLWIALAGAGLVVLNAMRN